MAISPDLNTASQRIFGDREDSDPSTPVFADTLSKLSLRKLGYFFAASQFGSVQGAAEALNVSAPSVSTAISQLEALLQVQLFVRRHSRGLVLTGAGRDAAACTRNILLLCRELETIGPARMVGGEGPLTIGCVATVAPYLLPQILAAVRRFRPRAQIRWRADNQKELFENLEKGSIDLVVAYDIDVPSSIHYDSIREMPPQIVLPAEHALAEKNTISLREVAGEPFVLLDLPSTRNYFPSIFDQNDIEPVIAHRTDSFEMLRSLVANGFGYSLLNFCPPFVVAGQKRIVSRPLVDPVKPHQLVLARLYRFRSPRLIEDLITYITTLATELTISAR
jgi:DNA-binding transcriptional LysR family regulator